MENLKKKIFEPTLSLFLCLFLVASFPVFAETIDEAKLAAQEGLNFFLESIPVGFEKYYGFENREEFSWAILGEPYQMYTIHPDNLIYERPAYTNFIIPLEEWRFPVIYQGCMRTLLTVAKMNGEWKAVAIGGSGIASELDRLEKIYSFGGYRTKRALLRLYQIKADFIAICDDSQKLEDGMFFPLQSARMAIGANIDELIIFSLPELLLLLKQKYRFVILNLKTDEDSGGTRNNKKRKK